MNRILATALVAAFAGHAAAQPFTAVEGGQATGLTLGEPVAASVPADRQEVARDALEAARELDSRSGQQSEIARDTSLDDFSSSRTRAEVRAEARVRVADEPVYEGGESS